MPEDSNLLTACLYIDGLNLYHRRLKDKPHLKWLNLLELSRLILPEFRVITVKYFTSNVLGSMSDALAPSRQKAYLRALATLGPDFELHLGRSVKDVRLARAYPQQLMPSGKVFRHKTIQSIEKESDVSLAVQLVTDATKERADAYFLLSNDSDFVPAIRYVLTECNAVMGLISPSSTTNKYLEALGMQRTRVIADEQILQSQFPETISDKWGQVTRPTKWL